MKSPSKRGTTTVFTGHLKRLLDAFRSKPQPSKMAEWLILIEELILAHSGLKARAGPTKGHSETDTVGMLNDLTHRVVSSIQLRNRGRVYDGNMAAASQLGLILVAWYCHVHRAKSYDPNRPLDARRSAARQRTQFLTELAAVLADDSLMGEVWGNKQRWNFPFGRGAKGGKFL